MKKRIAVLLTVAMAAAAVFSPMTAAAASGTASSIRLEQTQGSVTVKNSAGKELKASSGSRLNSGSSVSTAKASYAYMSLDSSKAAKLDASSKASVRKSGSKLELRSEKGSLMFNVSSPLKSSENMNIRTSSMVAGVRGTAGWVFNPDANTSVIYLLEGALDVSAIDPVTGEQKQVTITGGQGVFATRDTSGKYAENGVTITIPGMGGPRTIILREETESLHVISFEFKEEDVPGFVAVEVAKDPQLQQKITDLTDLSVPEIIGAAEEKLASEEAAAEEKDTEIQQALEEVTVETTDQVFESTKESSSGGGGGYTPPTATAFEVTAASYGAIVQGISDASQNGFSEVNVILSPGGNFTSNGSTLSVPENMTVNLNSQNGGETLIIEANDNLQVDGTLNVENNASVTVEQGASVSINSANSLHVKGSLVNSGTIDVGKAGELSTTPGALIIEDSGRFNNGGSITICSGSSLTFGTTEGSGSPYFQNDGTIEISSGGSIYLAAGEFYNGGTITLEQGAEMQLKERATLNNTNTINNSGTITNDGTIKNDGTITNNGTFTNNKEVMFSETFYDTTSPAIQNNSIFTISSSASMTVTGNGQFTNSGTVTNSGIVTVTSSGIVTNTTQGALNISNTGKMTLGGSSKFETKGTINVEGNGEENSGTVTNSGIVTVTSSAIVANASTGALNISNSGTMTVTGSAVCKITGKINVDRGTLMVYGDVTVSGWGNIKEGENNALNTETGAVLSENVIIDKENETIYKGSANLLLDYDLETNTSGIIQLSNSGKLLCHQLLKQA